MENEKVKEGDYFSLFFCALTIRGRRSFAI